MRKITRETCEAFRNCRRKKMGNSEVQIVPSGNVYYYLHGNTIAIYSPRAKILTLYDAKWRSNTTKDRLNGILQEFGLGGIFQKDYSRYYTNGNETEKRTGHKLFDFNS